MVPDTGAAYLFGRPDPANLSPDQRVGLRDLFKDYAFELVQIQKKSDVRNLVDLGGIFGGLAMGDVVGLVFGLGVLARNRLADRRWKRRMAEISRLAERIANLV